MTSIVALQDNANQTPAALVDDPLQGVSQLLLRVLRHTLQFCLQIVAHDLMEAAPKNIGLPDFAGIALKLLQQIIHHVLGLLFRILVPLLK